MANSDHLQEYEEEERQKRLGPGGLDPEEVYNNLPEELRKCFDSRNVELLQETISKMDEEEAKYHMKRCVDSGQKCFFLLLPYLLLIFF